MLLLILALAIGNLPKEFYACRGKNSFLDNSVCESWFMAVRVRASALKALPLPSNNACQVGAAFCPMLICKGPRAVGNILQAGIPPGNTNRR